MSAHVSIPAQFTYIDRAQGAIPMAAIFTWSARDPHAITIRFPRNVEWVVGRELLADALNSQPGWAGEGDVRFASTGCGCHLLMALNSPDGSAIFMVPREEIAEVLFETEGQAGDDFVDQVERFLASEVTS